MFSDTERMIFEFNDGKQTRKVDPLEISIALANCEVDFDADVKLVQTLDQSDEVSMALKKDAMAALGRIIVAARTAFNILPMDKGGLTVNETLGVMRRFSESMAQKKSELSPSPT